MAKACAYIFLLALALATKELRANAIDTTEAAPEQAANNNNTEVVGAMEHDVSSTSSTNGARTTGTTKTSNTTIEAVPENGSGKGNGSSESGHSKEQKYSKVTYGESTKDSNTSTVYHQHMSSEKSHSKWVQFSNPQAQGSVPGVAQGTAQGTDQGPVAGASTQPGNMNNMNFPNAPMGFSFGGFPNMMIG